jgi:hypothetical protein
MLLAQVLVIRIMGFFDYRPDWPPSLVLSFLMFAPLASQISYLVAHPSNLVSRGIATALSIALSFGFWYSWLSNTLTQAHIVLMFYPAVGLWWYSTGLNFVSSCEHKSWWDEDCDD